ncbi:histidine kinase dimerization/phospho-acceptor domain-containing protein [Rhodococcus sp. 3Y1]
MQIVDADHRIVAQSPGTDSDLLSERFLGPDESDALGRVKKSDDEDYWLIGRGAQTATGPVTVFVGADREPVETVVTTVAVLLAIVGPLVLGLAAFATYRLVGSALAPVERIRARVASISSGRQGERVPVPSGNDEIARLATTMNDMLARLDEGALAQQRFVSDASHELRSPLSTITTALELAHRRPDLLDNALIEDALLPEARRMRQLIEDLLILARSDESELESSASSSTSTSMTSCSPSRKDRRYLRSYGRRCRGSGSGLRRPESIDADGAKPRGQCSAACGDPRVSRKCSEAGNEAHIVIEDDGPGIPAAERERIFGRFVRLDQPRSRQEAGPT